MQDRQVFASLQEPQPLEQSTQTPFIRLEPFEQAKQNDPLFWLQFKQIDWLHVNWQMPLDKVKGERQDRQVAVSLKEQLLQFAILQVKHCPLGSGVAV